MKLFTLLAGYAAWLAVAMKYRKDKGISKLTDIATGKSKVDSFIDEIVDIHKSAFSDVKSFARENFDDVENFDDLQKKVSTFVWEFSSGLDSQIETAKKTGIVKKDELMNMAKEFYSSHEKTLISAKKKAASFAGISEDTIDTWLDGAHREITKAYKKIESQFAEMKDVEVDIKKTTPKKTTPKKSSTPKTPAK